MATLDAVRLTVIAVMAYALARWLQPRGAPLPLLAPLTALLVVQVSALRTLHSVWQRVLAVAFGVLTAVALAQWLGFSWWSLGLAILAGLLIGFGLRLGDQALEVPISAMLIFSLGAANEGAAWDRILETLIGAAVGLTAGLAWPPVRIGAGREALADVGHRLGHTVDRMASDLRGDPGVDHAENWLSDTKQMLREMTRTDEAIGQAEESVRLNPRALTLIDAGVALRDGLEMLEHFDVSLRTLTRAIVDSVRTEEEDDHVLSDPSVRTRLADVLDELAEGVRVYTALAVADLTRDAAPRDLERRLDALVASAGEDRHRLAELLTERDRGVRQRTLYGEILMHIDRLINYLHPEHRERARRRWRNRDLAARHLPERPADLVRKTRRGVRQASASAGKAARDNAATFDDEDPQK
ncbi:FUSC family protein [Actinomadura harenae]|uniref:FUSC family protein n=1 Tax=Actinomadura harenae TaxID=2483351 RepID=A0A3M2LYB7_9ACTN|nr:FUSC family protein [Actinomadura harenae]